MTLTSTRGVGGGAAPAFLANTGMPLLFEVLRLRRGNRRSRAGPQSEEIK